MAEKGTRKAKPKPGESVLASLPATRPSRMSNRRRGPAKPKATAKPQPAAKPRPAAKAGPKPTPIAEGASSRARPQPVRSASQKLAAPARKAATKRAPAQPESSPSGTELVTTVVQAAGELAQVGLSIGGQVLKRAVERLPKP